MHIQTRVVWIILEVIGPILADICFCLLFIYDLFQLEYVEFVY